MYATDLVDALKAFDLEVREVAGWKTRGHGPLVAVKGAVAHHTAGPKTGNYPSLTVVTKGRSGLPGPLCNLGLARDGSVYVVAAGLAYHAGVGAYSGLPSGNSYTIGIEAESTGKGDWTASQLNAYPRLLAALTKHYGYPVALNIGHLEWAMPRGRKIDPAGWPGGMKGLRASVQKELDKRKPVRPVPRPSRPSRAKARVALKLVVDGKFGPASIKALQKALKLKATGVYDRSTKKALQRHLKVTADGVVGPSTVRALQRRLKVTADGQWGPKTTAALQRALNAGKF